MSKFHPDTIVIHCTATPYGRDYNSTTLPFDPGSFSSCPYHIVISRDGSLSTGRPFSRIGAGVKGHNWHTYHVAYVGGLDAKGQPSDTRTSAQTKSIATAIRILRKYAGKRLPVVGHRDLNGHKKECPCFDATIYNVTI